MDKRFIAILVAVVAILGGMYLFSQNKSNSNNGSNGSTKAVASVHKTGEGKKGVLLIEYGDFECPACGAFFPILQQVKQKYGDDITFQFRNFPLDSIHQNARSAARAAEAASKQGKFWEMHDLLYQNQQTWKQSSNPLTFFEGYAAQLNLDAAKFKSDYQSTAVNDTINADIAAGQKIKATSTPTFQLNGVVIDSETQQTMGSLEGFSKVIDAEIAKVAKSKGNPVPAPTAPTPAPGTPAPAPAPVITPTPVPNQ